ncbi:MAG: transketolase C-terminal domain-containing protein [Candidatus Neomarinimicrobiota bacterium]
MRDHFIKRLSELVENNPDIILITGDLGFGVFDNFRKAFPKNFINIGVAEQNMTGVATGLALEGKIVFTYSIANFPTLRCLEQIRNDACYHNADVKVVSIGGGFSYGALGISHHATEDLSIMRSLPEIKVISPCGYWETTGATEAVVNSPGTCYLRLDKSAGDDRPVDKNEKFIIGKARILKNGFDCTIIVTGGILEEVINSSAFLMSEGISSRIVSMHTLKPIDEQVILKAVEETHIIITVEEHTVFGGLGSAVSEVLMKYNYYPKKFLSIGLKEGFSSIVGSQKYLRKRYNMDAQSIYNQIKSLLVN